MRNKLLQKIILSGYGESAIAKYYFVIVLKKINKVKDNSKKPLPSKTKKKKLISTKLNNQQFRIVPFGQNKASIYLHNELLRVKLIKNNTYYEFEKPLDANPEELLDFSPNQLDDKIIIKIKPRTKIIKEAFNNIEFGNTSGKNVLKYLFVFTFDTIQRMNSNPIKIINHLVSELIREGMSAKADFTQITKEGILFTVHQHVNSVSNVGDKFVCGSKRITHYYNNS